MLLQRQRNDARIAKQLAELQLETGLPMPTPPSSTPGGDETRMRGVPILAGRVGGAIRGTRPDHAVMARDDQRVWRRRLLSSQSNGVREAIPGSQPEDAAVANWGHWPERPSFDRGSSEAVR